MVEKKPILHLRTTALDHHIRYPYYLISEDTNGKVKSTHDFMTVSDATKKGKKLALEGLRSTIYHKTIVNGKLVQKVVKKVK